VAVVVVTAAMAAGDVWLRLPGLRGWAVRGWVSGGVSGLPGGGGLAAGEQVVQEAGEPVLFGALAVQGGVGAGGLGGG